MKKSTAIVMLVLYAINPLHAVLHCGHSEEHQCLEHSHSEKSEKFTGQKLTLQVNHDCFLCQNSQSKSYYLSGSSVADVKEIQTAEFLSSLNDSQCLPRYGTYAESRGPPNFL